MENISIIGIVLGSNVGAAVVAALVTLLMNFVNSKREHSNFYSTTVSKERVNWINDMRELTVQLLVFCDIHKESVLSAEDHAVFVEIRAAMLLRITPAYFIEECEEIYKKHNKIAEGNKYERDKKLRAFLSADYADVSQNIERIQELVEEICKSEWNRIKAEAGGNKNIERKIRHYENSTMK